MILNIFMIFPKWVHPSKKEIDQNVSLSNPPICTAAKSQVAIWGSNELHCFASFSFLTVPLVELYDQQKHITSKITGHDPWFSLNHNVKAGLEMLLAKVENYIEQNSRIHNL